MTTTLLLLSVFVNIPSVTIELVNVDKPKTLKIPMLAPLTGPVNPTGAFCTESVSLALSAINSQKSILPNYHIVVDIADDQCLDFVGERRMISFLENIKSVSPANRIYGNAILPTNVTDNYNATKVAYIAPLIIGGMCSAVCKVTARLPQHFHFIDVVAGCNDPALTERTRYPNFYRYDHSLAEIGRSRLLVMDLFNWTKIAILSDTIPASFMDTWYFLKNIQLQKKKIETKEEVFLSDPEESIIRIKNAGYRLIFASCLNTCPTIACAAYKQGFYGPRIIWIFNTNVDLQSNTLPIPKGCSLEIIATVIESSLFIGDDFLAALQRPDHTTDSGLSLRAYNQYLGAKVPGYDQTTAPIGSFICYESAHIAARILHDTEIELNLQNETLSDVIADPSRQIELSERIRRSALAINSTGLWGRIALQPSTTESYNPVIVVEQVQSYVRKGSLAIEDPMATELQKQKIFRVVRRLRWQTPDGLPPESKPKSMNRVIGIPTIGVYTAVAVDLALIVTLVVVERFGDFLTSQQQLNHFNRYNTISVAGTSVLLSTIFFYPSRADKQSMDFFCASAAPLVSFGFCLTTASLVAKVWAARVAHNLNELLKRRRCGYLIIVTWFVVNFIIVVAWYISNSRPVTIEIVSPNYDNQVDILWLDTVYTCSSISGFLPVLIALHCAFIAAGIVIGLSLSRKHKSQAVVAYAPDLGVTVLSIYMIGSFVFLSMFAFSVFREEPTGQFGITLFFGISNFSVVVFVLHRTAVRLILWKVRCRCFGPVNQPDIAVSQVVEANTLNVHSHVHSNRNIFSSTSAVPISGNFNEPMRPI